MAQSGAWKGRYTSKDRTFADKAIAVHICRGCGEWHERAKPAACGKCGRMDFDDFPSKGEAMWWVKLLRRQERGEIDQLERQVRIPLVTVHRDTGKPVWFADYIADFRWRDVPTGERITAECKPGGQLTYESQLKLRCVEAAGILVTALT